MFSSLPKDATTILDWQWPQLEPYYRDLQQRELNGSGLHQWLSDWTRISQLADEIYNRLFVAVSADTGDKLSEARYNAFLDAVAPPCGKAEQGLKQKLLDSGLGLAGFEAPLRRMRNDASIYAEKNLELLSRDRKTEDAYYRIAGAQTVTWDGQERTIAQLRPFYQDADRARREAVWRLGSRRQLCDRSAVAELWRNALRLRLEIAGNAGFDDYRAFRWKQLRRFDYTPGDCRAFHDAIERVAVPAAGRILAARARKLGLGSVRPWDLDVDPLGRPPLKPFATIGQLTSTAASIFHRVDVQLGGYFDIMAAEKLLDLENRKNKAPGGYCTSFPASRRPFIFMNAVGLHQDVQTLLHEGGHCFHTFETRALPYAQQTEVGMEFSEVASMAMELLAAPYLAREDGGFYGPSEAARARVEHLEDLVLFWPYMAVVDGFQHWAYQNPQRAEQADECDAAWAALWRRFMPFEDWQGLDQEMMTGWQRRLHIFTDPFYYVEYGMAQLGAVQIWGNALKDQKQTVADYRRALALGGTVSLPELFAAANARFAFDAGTLQRAVGLVEEQLSILESNR